MIDERRRDARRDLDLLRRDDPVVARTLYTRRASGPRSEFIDVMASERLSEK